MVVDGVTMVQDNVTSQDGTLGPDIQLYLTEALE